MDILANARALSGEIAARATEIEEARRLPADLAAKLSEAGLFRMLIPESLNGMECDPLTFTRAIETVAQADGSTGWCAMIASTTALVAAYLPEEHARPIYGAPHVITGGVFAPMGKAVVEGERYRVSGRWQWASGSANCHWLMGGCMIIENGEIARLPNGAPDPRMVLFEAKDVELIDTWHVSGLKGTGSGDMAVTDLLVPRNRSVSLVTDTPQAPGPLYAFPVFGMLALGIAAVALGNARGAIEDLKALAVAKRRGGAKRTVAETGHGQMTFARAEAELRAARAYLYEAVGQAWNLAKASGDLTLETRAHLRLAATKATETAADAARAMYELAGGGAVYSDSSLQRRFRDAHVATHHIMIAPATYEMAGRALFGLETDATFL